MIDETSKFKMEQLNAKIHSFMKREGKPLCECGSLAMVGSKMCSDCFSKAIDSLTIREYQNAYGRGKNI